MNQYYIIISSTYKNIIRTLNIISMLLKPPISFNHLPDHEKEVVTYGESRKSNKFPRVAGNCRAHKLGSIDNFESVVLCAARRHLHQLWECSVSEAMKQDVKIGSWAKNDIKPVGQILWTDCTSKQQGWAV